MSYLVLARKYRPTSFNDVIGQEHLTSLLKKAIEKDRVAHAYLFCGPRGIGKTSCARILAKCLNCTDGPAVNPPADDPQCLDIDAGRSMDVLEIDGASNRGIDEIRTLRENVKFAPSYGRYKIYIVDEVHMLTTEAFNALLKTLEEPPEHVKFILATTDPNKLPATILSRCQRFDFKRISVKTIVQAVNDVAAQEKLELDTDAQYAIAKAAQGSLRDAMSILDQLSSLTERTIKGEDVYSMLGIVELDLLFELTGYLAAGQCTNALKTLELIIDKGKDIRQLGKDLTEHFRNLMIIKIGGKSLGKLVDYPVSIKELYLNQSQHMSLEFILAAIDSFIAAQETARITESLRIPLELSFARLTQGQTPSITAADVAEKSSPTVNSVVPQRLQNQKGHVVISNEDVSEEGFEKNLNEEPKLSVPEDASELTLDLIKNNWDALTHAVSRQRMSIATFLQEGIPNDVQGSRINIGIPNEHSYHKEALDDNDVKKFIEDIFAEQLKQTISLSFILLDDAGRPLEDEEPIVQSALDTFQGKIVNKWHKD